MAMRAFKLNFRGADLYQRRRLNPEEAPAGESVDPPATSPQDASATTRPAQQACTHSNAQSSTMRTSRHRPTSYYSTFQTSCSVSNDAPPSYAVASRARPKSTDPLNTASEKPPTYSCTVEVECRVLLSLESANPLSPLHECEWKEVFLVLRGTLLSFYRVKDKRPGKLLRSYTLQHAEVGLATDSHHAVLIPQSRLANLIPTSARRRAWQKDPNLFKADRQTLLRLRVETDQMLLADSDEERIHSLIYSLSAAIDISHAIDERSIPRQCTVPRRRRRPRQHFNGDLTDPTLVAEQARIMRQMYPGLTGLVADGVQSNRNSTIPVLDATGEVPAEAPPTPAREEEEIDFSMIREETATGNVTRPHSTVGSVRPALSRQTTSNMVNSTFSDDMIYASPSTNFNGGGKWHPPHHRTAAQVQRYIKRCLPVLLANSNRASDIIVCNGKRMKINWRMELLEEWELQPPNYKSHHFTTEDGIARSNSQRSTSASATQAAQRLSIVTAEDDQITQVDQGLENLNLSKLMSVSTIADKCAPAEATLRAAASMDPKGRSPEQLAREIQGVVYCF